MSCRLFFPSRLVVLLAVLAALAAPAGAQTERGAIAGRVTDSTGAVLPGATVTVANQATGTSQLFVTNDDGLYEAPFLSPGLYRVTAELQGLAASAVDVRVNVGSRARVDVTLQPAGVQTEVQVVARVPLVQTESASVGQVVGEERLTTLPTGDRNIYSFMTLTSTVTAPPGGNAPAFRVESGGTFAISGSRPSSVTFKIDGLANTDPTFGTPTITPSLDAVQEFQLQNNAYSAEFEGVGQVNVATKAGTQVVHGSTFEFLRNEALQPKHPLTGAKSRLRFNQFGGSFGGPLWGLDETFFFFSYEGRRADTLGVATGRVLTAEERAGDFSAALGGCQVSAGAPVPLLLPNAQPSGDCVRVGQIFDPLTTTPNPAFDPRRPVSPLNAQFIRQPFPGNRIPAARIDQLARALIEAQQPLPNYTETGVNNFQGPAGTQLDNDQWSIRMDQVLSARDRLYARLAIQDNERVGRPLLPYQAKNVDGKGRVFAANWSRILGSRAVNEFRAGYVRGIYGDSIAEVDPAEFGIRNTFLRTLPRIFLRAGNLNFGGFSASILSTTQDTYQAADNFSLIGGAHSLKAGFAIDHNRFRNGELGNNTGGTATFGGLYTLGNNGLTASTANAMADFLLGMAEATSLNRPAISRVRNTPWNAYVQDDWRVHDRLTVNLGLRYEYHQRWRETSLGGARFDFEAGRLVVADPRVAELSNTPLVACCTDPRVVDTDRNDFGPRIGAVLQPFGQDSLVVRAGYGLFYSPMTQFFTWRQYEPFVGDVFQATEGDFLQPGATLDNPFSSDRFTTGGGVQPSFPSGVPPEVLGNQPIIGFSALGTQRTPYMHQWSVSIQREVLPEMLAEVTYLGSLGRSLPIQWIFNQPTPSPVPVNFASADPAANPYLRRPYSCCSLSSFVVDNVLESEYNAVTVKVDKRWSDGYQFLSAYTWSKSIDQGSEVFAVGNTFNILSNNRDFDQDRGRSSYDVPHRWVTSGTLELPFGAGKPWLNRGGLANALAGGWRVSGVFTLQSGFPFTPNIRNRRSNTGYTLATERGDLVGDPYWSDEEWERRLEEWTNGDGRLFLINPQSIGLDYPMGTFGNIPRNFFRAPYGRNVDLAFAKLNRIGSATLEVRADILNVLGERLHRTDLNAVVFASNLLTNPFVGSIPPYKAMFNPRLIQVGARVTF